MKITIFILTVVLSLNEVITCHKVKVEENLKALEEEIKELKLKIEDEIRDLNRYRSALQINFNNKIESRKKEDVKSILALIEILYKKMDTLVCNARENNKDPTNCYGKSQVATRSVIIYAYTSFNKCTKEAQQFIDQVQTNIDQIISTGQSLIATLDRTFQDCYSRTPKIMLRCVNRLMKKLQISFKMFQSNADSKTTIGDTAFHQGHLYSVTCYRDVVNDARERGQRVLADGENCIASC